MFKYNPPIKDINLIAYNDRTEKIDIKSIFKCEVQGYSSTTYIVEYMDNYKIIIQFRRETLNKNNFLEARKILGNIVPDIKKIDSNINNIVYKFSYIPGITLSTAMRQMDCYKFEELLPKISSKLGEILAKCVLKKSSFESLNEKIIPELKSCILNRDVKLLPYMEKIKNILNSLNNFETYPLALIHGDISPTNILINTDGNITGLVDWEDMSKLPFGIDLSCIHWLIRDQNYQLRKNWKNIETLFWESLFKYNTYMKKNKKKLEIILHIGCLMLVAHNGKCMDSIRCDEQLDIELSYKIPDF